MLREVSKIGADQAVENLSKNLKLGIVDADPENIVFGQNGLFYVDDKGILTRVIVHIVDKPLDHFEHSAKRAVEQGEFSNPEVLETAHRYHLLNCRTLRQAKKEGWRDKYKMNQNTSGNFYYRFIRHNKVFRENNNQKLHPCFHCLEQINSKHKSKLRFSRSNFSPEIFFSEEFRENWLIDSNYVKATQSVPNCYQQDWDAISNKYKEKTGFQCEEANCRYPDLSDLSMRKYLHCHHLNMDKTNNNFSNLKALCLECHANQPNHSHMKNKTYHEYCQIINFKLKHSSQ